MAELRLSYYPDITQHRSPAEVRGAVVAFAGALSDEMSRRAGASFRVLVLDVVSVPGQVELISNGGCEIALIKPSAYVYAHGRNPEVLPAAVALRLIDGKVGDTYFAQLYTHVDTQVQDVEGLRRLCRKPREMRPSLGFGDSFSTANFLVPAAMLIHSGLHPLTRFRRVEFLGGHDGVARAVYHREVDVGAGHDGVIVDLARQKGFGDAEAQMVRIARRDIHSDPVAVRASDDVRALLTEALLAIAHREDVKTQLDVFWGAVKGLGPARHENYASIETAIDAVGISEADVLGV
jgi:ABC-type phosphate/phosphonate transport system substrate-binding protein